MDLHDELKLALFNLVKLKEHKDTNGKDEFYQKHQPIMWEYAKQVLKKCEGKESSHESGNCNKPDVSNSVCTCGSLNYGYGFAKCFDCGKIKDI